MFIPLNKYRRINNDIKKCLKQTFPIFKQVFNSSIPGLKLEKILSNSISHVL